MPAKYIILNEGGTMRAIAAILLVTTILGCTPTTTSQKESQPATPPSPTPPTSTAPPASTAPSPSSPPQSTRPVYNLSGYSPSFKDGYIDGCETAKKTANGAKDEQRFAGDKQYRLGWNDGFSLCGRNRAEK